MTARTAILLLCVALAVAGCSSAGSDQAPAPVPTTTRPSYCVDIADKVRALADEIRALPTETTLEQVRAAATQLSDAVDDARAAAGADLHGALDEAGQALDRLQDALRAQPVDWAGLRAATNDLAAALDDATAACTPAATS